METVIICDAASDITFNEAKNLGINLVSATVSCGEKHFLESTGITKEEYWDLLEQTDMTPTTSAATPWDILNAYKNAYDSGCKNIIVVTINSSGSSTYDNACLAKNYFNQEFEGNNVKFDIIDSKTYTYCYGDAVLEGAKMLRDGISKATVVNHIKDSISRSEAIAGVFDLKFARKSGRISNVSAFVGEMLGVKPILGIKSSSVNIIGKVRGHNFLLKRLIEMVKNEAVDLENQEIRIISGKISNELKENFYEMITKELHPKAIKHGKFGCSITTNTGPHVIGISYKGKKREE